MIIDLIRSIDLRWLLLLSGAIFMILDLDIVYSISFKEVNCFIFVHSKLQSLVHHESFLSTLWWRAKFAGRPSITLDSQAHFPIIWELVFLSLRLRLWVHIQTPGGPNEPVYKQCQLQMTQYHQVPTGITLWSIISQRTVLNQLKLFSFDDSFDESCTV